MLAANDEIEALHDVSELTWSLIPDGSWASQMPTWRTRNHKRGLLGWGETRKDQEDGGVALKKGAIKELCRVPILGSVANWFKIVGLPPTDAGESIKRAIAEGRIEADAPPLKRHKGCTRGQAKLVRVNPPLNLKSVFLLFVACDYMEKLDPKVDYGTDGQRAGI